METQPAQDNSVPVVSGHDFVRTLPGGGSHLFRQQRTGAPVVVRRLSMVTPEIGHRFRAFQQVRSQLICPFRIRIDEPSGAYFIREYIEGAPLREALAAGRLSAPLEFVTKLLSAAASFHDYHLAHGNLHPGNVIIDAQGAPRIVDALAHASPADHRGSRGLYSAPEQLRGRRPTLRSDVFSLGAMVHELLGGNHPFPGDPVESMRRILYEAPIPLQLGDIRISQAIAAVLEKALSKRAFQRPASGRRMLELVMPHRSERSAERFDIAPPTIMQFPAVREPGLSDAARTAVTRMTAATILAVEAVTEPKQAKRSGLLLALGVALAVAGVGFWRFSRDARLAREVASLLERGKLADAREVLRLERAERPKDMLVQKLLADVTCASGDLPECMRRYHEVLARDDDFASEVSIRNNVLELLSREGDASAAMRVVTKLGSEIEEPLMVQSRHPEYSLRWNAVRALEARGASEKIDYGAVYALDLRAKSCATRRAAAAKLAQLKSPEVLPLLREAQARARSSNSERGCIGDAIDRAIDAITAAE